MEGNKAVAVIVLKEHDQYVTINDLAVAPAHQGKGWGKAMLQLGEILANKRGKEQTQLYADVKSEDDFAFYKKAGYSMAANGLDDGYGRVCFQKYV